MGNQATESELRAALAQLAELAKNNTTDEATFQAALDADKLLKRGAK